MIDHFGSVGLALLLALTLAAPVAMADAAHVFSERIHGLIESGDAERALEVGIDAMAQYPDDHGILHNLGRAAFITKRYHLSIYYLKRALAIRPGYSSSLLYLGAAENHARLTDDARNTLLYTLELDNLGEGGRSLASSLLKQLGPAPTSARESTVVSAGPVSRLPFYTITPYMALLEYAGPVPRHGGYSQQLDIRAGYLGLGYIDASLAGTSVETLPYLPDYDLAEYRLGFGWFITPAWLLKAKGVYLESLGDDGANGHFVTAGFDWPRRGVLRGGLTTSHGDYPDGAVIHLTPHVAWCTPHFSLTTSLDAQQWNPTEGDKALLMLFRQDLILPVPDGGAFGLGYAAGGSRYGHAGFGDVIYSLPDEQTGSVYVQYTRPLHPFALSAKAAINTYESLDGDTYHSTAHTISLGYLSRNARAAVDTAQSRWSLLLGLGARRIRAVMDVDAADPLVTETVGPLTFSDDTGQYTSIYDYGLDSVLETRHEKVQESIVSPWLELRRKVAGSGMGSGIQFYGRYTFAPYAYELTAQSAGYQSVREVRSDYFNGSSIGGGSGIYSTYNVTQSGRFDLNLHEFALGVESVFPLTDRIQVAVGGGFLVGIADWTSSRVSEWMEDGTDTVLDWVETYGTGVAFSYGATADLRLRWIPAPTSSWFIEAGAGYIWHGELEINEPPIAAAFDLGSFNGTIGIGLR